MNTQPIIIGESITIQSEILGQERTVYISLPDGYHDDTSQTMHYPVAYAMDGEACFRLFSGLLQLHTAAGTILPMILVAIPNVDRDNDFDPKTGAAEKFLNFMETELIPLSDSRYRTFPYRMLHGHSYLGIFAIRALLSHPQLFEAYIASSPSLRWNPELLEEESLFDKLTGLNKFLFITAASDDIEGLENMAREFTLRAEKEAPPGLAFQFKVMEHENHDTNSFRSFNEGLAAISKWYVENRQQEIPMDDVPA